MSWIDRALGSLGYVPRGRAAETPLQEATPANRAKEDAGWRRLSDTGRDLSPVTHDRQREIAVYLWTYNPLARRIINAMVEYVVGEGVQVQAEHEQTQEYLDRFWKAPVNRWDLRMEEKTRELYLMGEQFWPAFTNQYSGLMTLGILDPARVKEVVTDPDNALMVIGVVTRGKSADDERRIRSVLREEEISYLSPAALAERERFVHGELFPFAVNKLSNQKRGVSEIFALADWLDGYEQLLFAQLQQERVRSMYIFDWEIQGATQEEIDEKLANAPTPKPFSIWAHNEKEKRTMVGPDAGAAANNAESARLFRNQILGGAAIPEHLYGGGGDVNRSTADSMTGPMEKSFSAKQRTMKYVVQEVLSVQVERGIAAGELPDEPVAREFDVVFPELSARDMSRSSAALQQVAAGLALAKKQGWVSDEVGARVMSSMISQFGVEADADEMLEKGKEQLAKTMAEEAARFMGRELAPEKE